MTFIQCLRANHKLTWTAPRGDREKAWLLACSSAAVCELMWMRMGSLLLSMRDATFTAGVCERSSRVGASDLGADLGPDQTQGKQAATKKTKKSGHWRHWM